MALRKIVRPTSKDDDGEEDEFDYACFTPVKAKPKSRRIGEEGVLRIINASRSGKRLELSSALLAKLGHPKGVKVLIDEYGQRIAVRESFPSEDTCFPVREGKGKRGIIYSAGLIDEISNTLGIEFSERVCVSIYSVKYQQYRDITAAVFEMGEAPILSAGKQNSHECTNQEDAQNNTSDSCDDDTDTSDNDELQNDASYLYD